MISFARGAESQTVLRPAPARVATEAEKSAAAAKIQAEWQAAQTVAATPEQMRPAFVSTAPASTKSAPIPVPKSASTPPTPSTISRGSTQTITDSGGQAAAPPAQQNMPPAEPPKAATSAVNTAALIGGGLVLLFLFTRKKNPAYGRAPPRRRRRR